MALDISEKFNYTWSLQRCNAHPLYSDQQML